MVIAAMTSSMLPSDADTPKTIDLWKLKVNGDSWQCVTNLDISLDIHLLGDLSRFGIYVTYRFEKSLLCTLEIRKKHFVPQSDNLRMHTEIYDLTMQKVSPDILMIILHKR